MTTGRPVAAAEIRNGSLLFPLGAWVAHVSRAHAKRNDKPYKRSGGDPLRPDRTSGAKHV